MKINGLNLLFRLNISISFKNGRSLYFLFEDKYKSSSKITLNSLDTRRYSVTGTAGTK
jgi:hypothetical protein